MKKINYQFIPALVLTLAFGALIHPLPPFSFYGFNWPDLLLALLWATLVLYPVFKKKPNTG